MYASTTIFRVLLAVLGVSILVLFWRLGLIVTLDSFQNLLHTIQSIKESVL